MLSDRDLVTRAVEGDLLGAETLFEADEPVLPDRYEPVRFIGRGGGGRVYLARDVTLDRHVAIKLLNDARLADLERFRREAKFTARLNNPSIVQVFELTECDDRPFIVMQYIDGRNLADAELDVDGVVRVVREVAEAMRHAHAEGIVHRDLKPENILVDADGRAYLTDFGIARHIRGDLGDTISREGQIMGTPALMPPEQARGEIQAVDARSDVYALGATLFFKLAGVYPFEATNVVDVLHAVMHDPVPLLRARNASLPRRLETVVYKCMQKRREHRYQNMDEVVAELDRYLEGAGDGGPEPSAWIRRYVGEVHGKPVEEPAEENLAADRTWTLAMELVREIATWDADLYRVSGSLERSFRRLDTIRDRLDEIIASRPDLAWPRFYRGVVLHRRGRLYEALEEMERSIDRIKSVPGALYELGRLYLALYLREHHLARKHISKVGIDHDLSSVRGRLDQAIVAWQESDRRGGEMRPWLEEYTAAVTRLAESDYDGCLELCDRILEHEPDIEEIWKLRGDTLRLAGGDPFESYERAVQVRRTYFEALHAAAEAHLARNEVADARTALQQACDIHPEFTDAFALLGRTYLIEGSLAEARRAAERAREIDPRSYEATVTLAETHLEAGRRDGDDDALVTSLGLLDAAMDLDGCGNRAKLISARVSLARVRLAHERGGDPHALLAPVAEMCAGAGSIPGSEAWKAILTEIEQLRSELSTPGLPRENRPGRGRSMR